MVAIITHRGLEPGAGAEAWGESTLESFRSQLGRGFGLEFDPNPASDGWVVWHDATLARLTGGADSRPIAQLPVAEVAGLAFGRGRVGTLEQVLDLIGELGSPASPSALHLKGERQTPELLESLCRVLEGRPRALAALFAFDVTAASAAVLRARLPQLQLAPSVSHAYDLERYNGCVQGTLWGLDEVCEAPGGLFGWAWVDEWDLAADSAGGRKEPPFAAEETFRRLRAAGLRVGLVTPELHSSSPGLLGGEAHEDAASRERLFARIRLLLSCGLVDAVCTDWPTEVRQMAAELGVQ